MSLSDQAHKNDHIKARKRDPVTAPKSADQQLVDPTLVQRASQRPDLLTPRDVLQLQRMGGNRLARGVLGSRVTPVMTGQYLIQRELKPVSGEPNIYTDTRNPTLRFEKQQDGTYKIGDYVCVYYPEQKQYKWQSGNYYYDPATGIWFVAIEVDGQWWYQNSQDTEGTLYYYDGEDYIPSKYGQNAEAEQSGQTPSSEQGEKKQEGALKRGRTRDWNFSGGFWTEENTGMMYYPKTEKHPEQLRARDFSIIKDEQILQEIRAIHDSQGTQQAKREKQERVEKRAQQPPVQRFSVDDYIKGMYRVEVDETVVKFLDAKTGKPVGMISYYKKGKAWSFDVSKTGGKEGGHKGVSYLMVYYLMKHILLDGEVQIEAFDSGGGTDGLVALYMSMGLDSSMHGRVDEIQAQCELRAKEKFESN